MKIPAMACFIMLAFGILFTIVGGIIEWYPSKTDVYEGKVVLWSDEEYVEFKKAIAPTEVRIRELDILSSEPPIIIQFRIEADKGLGFPYGKAEEPLGKDWMFFTGLPLSSCMIGLLATKRVDWD